MIDFHDFDSEDLLALSQHDIAKEQYDQALYKLLIIMDKTPDSEAATLTLAQLYAQLKLFKKSEMLFRSCLDKHEDDAIVRFQLGMTLFDQQLYNESLAEWGLVLSSIDNYPPALFYKGLALINLDKLDESKVLFTKIINIVRTDNLYYSRANDMLAKLSSKDNLANSSEAPANLINTDAYKTVQ